MRGRSLHATVGGSGSCFAMLMSTSQSICQTNIQGDHWWHPAPPAAHPHRRFPGLCRRRRRHCTRPDHPARPHVYRPWRAKQRGAGRAWQAAVQYRLRELPRRGSSGRSRLAAAVGEWDATGLAPRRPEPGNRARRPVDLPNDCRGRPGERRARRDQHHARLWEHHERHGDPGGDCLYQEHLGARGTAATASKVAAQPSWCKVIVDLPSKSCGIFTTPGVYSVADVC